MKTHTVRTAPEPPIPPAERMHTAKIEVQHNKVTVAVTCRFFDHEGNPADAMNPVLEVSYKGIMRVADLHRDEKGVYTYAFETQGGGYDFRLTSDGQRAAKADRFVWVS